MDGEVLYNKIWVIESLPEGDLKTGYNLFHDHLEYLKPQNPKITIAYERPDTKEEFLQVLDSILDDTSTNGNYPWLHIECHGDENGLIAADGCKLEWEELRPKLVAINQSCRLNLMVVVAACNGAYMIHAMTTLDRAPFFCLIGAETEIPSGTVERSFRSFYSAFFDGLGSNACMDALNKGCIVEYHLFNSLALFINAYIHYHKEQCVGNGKSQRKEKLLTTALEMPTVNSKGIKWARKRLKQVLSDQEMYFNKYHERLFMTDLFEENKKRFELSYEDFLERYVE